MHCTGEVDPTRTYREVCPARGAAALVGWMGSDLGAPRGAPSIAYCEGPQEAYAGEMALVLIIEDNPDVRDVMKKAVETNGHDTCVAGDGQAGLAQARQRNPDLILLDLMMPIMDGWKFRSEQMKDPHIADIPVVVVSAYMDIQEIDAIECIAKPCTVVQLLDAVERHRRRSGDRVNGPRGQG